MLRWAMLGLVLAVGMAASRGPRFMPRSTLVVVASVCFLGFAAISSIGGANVPLALTKLLPLAAEVLLAVAILSVVMKPDDWTWLLQRLRWLLGGLCAAALLIGVLAPGAGGVNPGGRLAAISNPNSTGFLAMVASCLSLWHLGSPSLSGRSRKVALGSLAACAWTVWWTGSRASIGGCLVGLGLWAVAQRRWKLAFVGILAAGLLVVVAPQMMEAGAEAAEATLLRGGGLTSSREFVWEASLAAWAERPWLGYGYGISATADVWEEGQLGQSVGALRDGSGYLGVLESVGLVGATALGVLLIIALWYAFEATRFGTSAQARSLAAAGLSVIGALLTNAAAEPWLLGPGSFQGFLLWLTVGMVVGTHVDVGRAQAQLRRQGVRSRGWAHGR